MATIGRTPKPLTKSGTAEVLKQRVKKSVKPASRILAKKAPDDTTLAGTGIKYADKSAGQPQLVPIFNEIKNLMLPYVKNSIQQRGGEAGQMALVSEKSAAVEGGKPGETWFAGILVQKGYVGFYFSPIYTSPELKKELHPVLLKCLKGKSCFYIKKYDIELFAHIKNALAIGHAAYKKKGLI